MERWVSKFALSARYSNISSNLIVSFSGEMKKKRYETQEGQKVLYSYTIFI